MVQSKMAVSPIGSLPFKQSYFSLNHDYGRKRYWLILFLDGFVLTNFDLTLSLQHIVSLRKKSRKPQELAAGGALLGSHEALTLYRFKAQKRQKNKGVDILAQDT